MELIKKAVVCRNPKTDEFAVFDIFITAASVYSDYSWRDRDTLVCNDFHHWTTTTKFKEITYQEFIKKYGYPKDLSTFLGLG